MATRNPWLKFKGLLQGKGRTVVKVISNNGDGTSTVQLRGGEQITVVGETVAGGKKAIMKDGQLEYEVPDLSSVVIEI
ncbi:hypothetical protein BGP77_11595 [Saccharospirillum sp. MSK14-1]|uniref:hypothetical protein n=1 Tax=Saccharospirillum sp. MSK14-1 TaxID=1897632 RepID=UPI000D36775E|nr:hypothetical protein [Saccharospirillum sp. MSK14-1]PTY38582.1 hypothetical protein BGP77_11595 [Saccharospirillum sp. MSK14-1]